MDKAEEVLGVILPADKDAALPLDPSEEALDEPAPHVAAKAGADLAWAACCGCSDAARSSRCHLGANSSSSGSLS